MNKITLYFKQAWILICQNKLFSGIYIAGTGLAIALTMTLFVILYIKFAPLYPEYKRDCTLVIKSIEKKPKDTASSNFWQSTPNYNLVKMIRQLKSVDVATGVIADFVGTKHMASNGFASIPIVLKYTDADYWRVYDFQFIDGKPFNNADVSSNTKNIVVSQSCARNFFKTDNVIGKTIDISGSEYKIVGVVKDVASVMSSYTAADAWCPYTNTDYTDIDSDLRGDCYIAITAKTKDDVTQLKTEIDNMMLTYNRQDKLFNYTLFGPDIYWASLFRIGKHLDSNGILMNYGFILIALLVIPALNLSGMISSKMNKRLPELGIRKAYGATNSQLLAQILWENLLLTLIGGFVGIILCYAILLCTGDWITNLLTEGLAENVQLMSGSLSLEMLFNWWIFVAVLAICFILNIISAIIPASISLRHTIINSLNPKQ